MLRTLRVMSFGEKSPLNKSETTKKDILNILIIRMGGHAAHPKVNPSTPQKNGLTVYGG